MEVTPKGAQRSGAPRRCAVDGASTAVHSKTRATARRRSAGLPPRNVLDYWWGVPPPQVNASPTRLMQIKMLDFPGTMPIRAIPFDRLEYLTIAREHPRNTLRSPPARCGTTRIGPVAREYPRSSTTPRHTFRIPKNTCPTPADRREYLLNSRRSPRIPYRSPAINFTYLRYGDGKRILSILHIVFTLRQD